MPITTRSMTGRVHEVKISSTLTWNDFQISLRESEALMTDGKIGILVELENFAGWEPSEQWGDVNFFLRSCLEILLLSVHSSDFARTWPQKAEETLFEQPQRRGMAWPEALATGVDGG